MNIAWTCGVHTSGLLHKICLRSQVMFLLSFSVSSCITPSRNCEKGGETCCQWEDDSWRWQGWNEGISRRRGGRTCGGGCWSGGPWEKRVGVPSINKLQPWGFFIVWQNLVTVSQSPVSWKWRVVTMCHSFNGPACTCVRILRMLTEVSRPSEICRGIFRWD